MNKNTILALILLVHFSGCAGNNKKIETPAKPDTVTESHPIDFWLDKETETVHKIVLENGVRKIVSVIKYSEGKPLEVMKLIISESNNGKVRWIYFVPSTKYIVELTENSADATGIIIEWKNRTPEGVEDSGTDLLVRCNENGDVVKNEVNTRANLSDNFFLNDNIQ